MNNPFDYTPSAEMIKAQQALVERIEHLRQEDAVFCTEVDKGKMFGILRTDKELLFAFSGQIGDSFSWPEFVPPVLDYLDENGYFKVHEREISEINDKIKELESSDELSSAREKLALIIDESEADINHYRQVMKASKEKRDFIRGKDLASEADLVRESQFQKAELHRKKVYWREQREQQEAKINGLIGDIRLLKLQRQHLSDKLQRWLFDNTVFTLPKGKRLSVSDITKGYSGLVPSGTGECCEPKLLNYANAHGLLPIEIGMFWWGESPRQEVRHHLQFYPACNGKCKPILWTLLPEGPDSGEYSEKSRKYEHQTLVGRLRIVYEDENIIVVDKPAGMLSVPGKGNKESVFSILRAQHPECPELATVHRLDMDTSGLLIITKTKEAHKTVQRQFAEHTIRKEYIAILSKPLTSKSGVISLPLRPDIDDRPRQLVDHKFGKEAITHYEVIDRPELGGQGTVVRLYPLTGRTHQLRVHCAHPEGLNNPIKGDRLYGQKADRLYLHARAISTEQTDYLPKHMESEYNIFEKTKE